MALGRRKPTQKQQQELDDSRLLAIINSREARATLLALIPDSASAAAWVQTLAVHNGGLPLRDEIGQYLRAIEQQAHMSEIKGYLLQAYDGQTISRRIKHEELVIDRPRMVALGFSVDETWPGCVTPEMMLDGFAQRFSYVIARPRDTLRPLVALACATATAVAAALRAADSQALIVSPEAVAAYEEAFEMLLRATPNLPRSYFRRALFAAIKYALVYHVVLGKESNSIDASDIGWAARVVERHLIDGAKLLNDYGAGALEQKLRRVEALVASARASGRDVFPRDVVRAVATVNNVHDARALLMLALEGDKAATGTEQHLARGGRRPRQSKAAKPRLVYSR